MRPGATDAVARQLCAGGNVLEYRVITGSDHEGVMTAGAAAALAWIQARFAGQPVAGNCGALPVAAPR